MLTCACACAGAAAAKREADSGSAEVRALEARIEALRKQLDADLGADSAYWPLWEKCFSLTTDQYRYELCLFKDITQHGTSLGKFERWADAARTRQTYGGGQSCWQGPQRSTQLELVCGDAERLLDVHEPAKCEYHARFQTPAACQPARLDELDRLLQ